MHERAVAAEFLNLHEIVAKARQNLHQNNWDYIVGGTETETTLRRNRLSLDSVAFRPRVLCDVSKVDASVDGLRSAESSACHWCWPRSAPWRAFIRVELSRWCALPTNSAWRIC